MGRLCFAKNLGNRAVDLHSLGQNTMKKIYGQNFCNTLYVIMDGGNQMFTFDYREMVVKSPENFDYGISG